jgi:hypothetical protein
MSQNARRAEEATVESNTSSNDPTSSPPDVMHILQVRDSADTEWDDQLSLDGWRDADARRRVLALYRADGYTCRMLRVTREALDE